MPASTQPLSLTNKKTNTTIIHKERKREREREREGGRGVLKCQESTVMHVHVFIIPLTTFDVFVYIE